MLTIYTWTDNAINTKLKAADLKSVYLYSSSEGYAAGVNGTLLKTTDGGSNWVHVATNTIININKVFFKDANNGIALGADGYVYATTSAGSEWQQVSAIGSYKDFSMYDKTNGKGYAVGNSGIMAHIDFAGITTGKLFKKLINPSILLDDLGAVAAVSLDDVFMASATGNKVYKAAINGDKATYAEIGTAGSVNGFKAAVFTSNIKGAFLTNSGLVYNCIYISPNNYNLTDITLSTATYSDININSSGTLYALNSAASSQLHNSNAGWTSLSTVAGTTTAPVNSLFMKASNVLVVGNTGTILEHTGSAFTDNSTKTAPLMLRDIYAVPTTAGATTNTAYAVGNDGTVIRTTNGGSTWQTLNSSTAAQLNAIAFANTTDGVIVGNVGTTLKSTSSGITLQLSGTNNHLNDVVYNSTATRYSAAGQNRTILQSTDGGTSYATLGITGNTTETINGIADIGSTVHILGSTGYITKNTSGSWYVNYKMPYALAAMHIHKTNGLGMMVGSNSISLNTSDKGYTWWLNKPLAKTSTTTYNFTGVAVHSATAIYATAIASIPMRIDNMQATAKTNLTGSGITSQDWNDVAIANNGKGYIGGAANKHAYFTAPATACTLGANTGAPSTYVVNSISVGVNKVFFACNTGLLFSKDISTNANATLSTGVSANLLKASMYDDLNGILMGASGTMLRMYDNNGNALFENKTTLNNNGTAVSTNIQAADYASRNHVVFGGASGHIKNLETEKQYTSLFWYDKLGRMVVSQNTKQYNKTTRAYSYTQYDALGRISEVGEIAQATSFNNQYVDKQLSDVLFASWVSAGARTEVTQTYYDEQFAAGGTLTQINLRKRVASVTYEDVFDNNAGTYQSATHYTYDIHGNVNRMAQEIRETQLLATGLNVKYVDYDYDLVSGKVNQVCYNAGSKDQYYHKYEYDGDNRITKVWTSKDNIWWDNDAKYNYYNHGPLARTVIGDLEVQGMDYAYTLHGWLKGVNSNTLQADRDMGKDGMPGSPRQFVAKDAMGYTLGYYAGDYTGIKTYAPLQQFEATTTGSDLMASRQDLYNGNISHMATALPEVAAYSATRTISPTVRGGAYKYDQLNRLIEARSFFNVSIAGNQWQSGGGTPLEYYENFGYDAMGNITNVQRWGNAGVQMDNMTYRYNTKTSGGDLISNKLYAVSDAVAAGNYTDDIDNQTAFTNAQDATVNTLNNYGYDELGNLKRDDAEQIQDIEWTVYGKIKKVTRTAPSGKPDLEFIYDAGGNRICKIVKPKPLNVATYKYSYYLRDAQGNEMANYELTINAGGNVDKLHVTARPIYGSSRLGVDNRKDLLFTNGTNVGVDTPGVIKYRTISLKSYELSNHLGNVLVTVSDKRVAKSFGVSTVDYFEPEITTISDYYAFGSPIPTRQWNDPNSKYKYGFNGMEKDDDINVNGGSYDFGARIYDSRLGRWLSLDPLANNYPFVSGYSGMNNSPIIIVDSKGEKIVIYYEKTTTITDPLTGLSTTVTTTESLVYKPMMTPPSDPFAKEAVEALNYLHDKSRKARREINKAVYHSDELKIVKTTGESYFSHSNALEPENRDKIFWNANGKLALVDNNFNSSTNSFSRYSTGQAQSPALGLMHELLHFNHEKNNSVWFFGIGSNKFTKTDSRKNRGYDNREEKQTIRMERKIAKQLNEPVRYNHRGIYVSSTKVDDASPPSIEEQQAINKEAAISGNDKSGAVMLKGTR